MNHLGTKLHLLVVLGCIVSNLQAQPAPNVRNAVNRALPPLQRSAATFVEKRACVSCHHNILPILTLDLAKRRGFDIDSKVLLAVEEKTFRQLRIPNALDDAIQATTLNDPTPNDSTLLMAAHDAGLPADLTTGVYARRLARWQRDGHWVTSDFRPPHSSSRFAATATAIRAIQFYMPMELAAERDATVQSARRWLFETRPASTEDAAFRLMGLAWVGAASNEIAAARRDLIALQKTNGGWPQLPDYEPDAYSSGEALVALHESGLAATDAAWTKGIKFLVSNQAQDGTWRVRTRMLSPAEVSPPYFATGFPYEKDEFISYAGSCWAVMALLSALPEAPAKPETPATAVAAADVPAWLRTALFGSVNELASLLDKGVDPNSKTRNGVTILMAAAPDIEKVRLLLSRGADAKARGPAGADALTIATAHRGSARSVELLLAAGALPEPPEDVRLRNAPLTLASMSGDLENVKLLISRGVQPTASALGEAVTFGYPDIVRTLIAAGADADLTESSGINLLHWAAIADRADVIPVLVEAKVPVNATDDNGFTPLMYAATIDFGDTGVLRALLKAGADKTMRNTEGQTPLALAQRYKHSRLEAALR